MTYLAEVDLVVTENHSLRISNKQLSSFFLGFLNLTYRIYRDFSSVCNVFLNEFLIHENPYL